MRFNAHCHKFANIKTMKIKYFYPVLPALLLFQSCGSNKIAVNAMENIKAPYAQLYHYKSVELRDTTQDNSLSLSMTFSGGGSRSSNFGKGALLVLLLLY